MSADDDDGNSAGPFLNSILFISIKQRNSIVKAKTASERVRVKAKRRTTKVVKSIFALEIFAFDIKSFAIVHNEISCSGI